MKLQRFALAAAAVGLISAAAASVPATAATPDNTHGWAAKATPKTKAATADACLTSIASPTAAGTVDGVDIEATRPVKTYPYGDPIKFVGTRANSTWYLASNSSATQFYYYGLFLQGGSLYRHTTYLPDSKPPVATFKKVGSGWTSFKSIATSNYSVGLPRHQYLYGLNSNGSLYRYSIVGAGFKSLGPLPGFRGFKAMTVLSENATYDTLLMTTNAGALWTVHIPVAAGAKPVLKLVRSSGWAAYESLVVYGCGDRGGSLVVGVDRDTKSGDLYGMSKANGSKTAFLSYGKVPTTFNGVDAVSITTHYDQLVGE
ncbi:hypothetical protein [Kribbella sp. NPDC004536]|uniref:hypothetical protein n=1 Tax=Kribbella sp. NPDC004536 TaxID=3364106 RepID=UPI0036B44151